MMMEKNPRSTVYFYVAVLLMEMKTKYNKYRRGLEQEVKAFYNSSERLWR